MTAGRRDGTTLHWVWTGARRYFVAGVVIVLPTFLTIYILWFLFGLLKALVAPFVQPFLGLFLTGEKVPLIVTAVSLLIGAGLVWLVGFTGAAFSRRFFERTEEAFGQIPFVRGIQRTVRQIIDLFLGKDASFKQVALIEYPRRGLYCICFVTNRERWHLPGDRKPRAVSVFLPTTPNPTSGYFLLVPEEDVIAVDISVDEALKVIISGGIVAPPRSTLPEAPLEEPRDARS